jgi:mycobactin lysine-N-oxygenase
MIKLAVIGAGAKGVALATKCQALADLNCEKVPRITVFENNNPGATWYGGGGFTDGQQFMCTPAERDLGFPYPSPGEHDMGEGRIPNVELFPNLSAKMLADYSFARFLIDSSGRGNYAEWVRSGRPPMRHATFARYLAWALNRATSYRAGGKNYVTIYQGRVIQIRPSDGAGKPCWIVETEDGAIHHFDGVVVTGNGPPSAPPKDSTNLDSTLLFNARTFWEKPSLDRIRPFLSEEYSSDAYCPIVIIGAGGAAAAVALRLAQERGRATIRVVGKRATLYARVHSYFEGSLFGSNEDWDLLGFKEKKELLNRVDRSVVWDQVLRGITDVGRVEYRQADVVKYEAPCIDALSRPIPGNMFTSSGVSPIQCDVLIDATGFDAIEGTRSLCSSALNSMIA